MKLNELLSVNDNLKTQAEKTRTELAATFANKKHHFSESVVTFTPNTEGAPPVTEKQLDLQTTVKTELKWLKPFLVKVLDSANKVAVANTQAKADLILETGETLLKDVPATSLLELGKRMAELLEFAKHIPTLDPAKGFTPDPNRGLDIFHGWDAPPHFTGYVCCNLCPGSFVVLGCTSQHKRAHEKWAKEGRPTEFKPPILNKKEG